MFHSIFARLKKLKTTQLLVIFSIFIFSACALLKSELDLNPCNCMVAQETNATSINLGKTTSQIIGVGQSFTATSTKTITKVSVKLFTNAAYSAPLKVFVYGNTAGATAADDVPDTSTIYANSINTVISNTSAEWVNFCLSSDCTSTSATLTANVKYWVVVVRANVGDNLNISATQFHSLAASSADPFTGGQVKVLDSGAPTTWSATDSVGAIMSGYDINFRIGCTSTDASCT